MPLDPGDRLGPYEIVSPIGKGGMGEVFRARDERLGRDVALKVLPDSFAADPERLARFQREAEVLASLNHPNIAQIYGLEESGGVRALVLELVEGPTLAERIGEGPVAIEEALAVATQMAEALHAGHEAGVVHRDLKPANVKLKEDGTVKVLDYGLAKAFQVDGKAESQDAALSQSPTLTRQGTQVGVILGTAAYMSPEQAKGKRVDKRTDVWAFGAVVYEMLTGRRAFEGEDVSDTLASVLRAEPDFSRLPDATPPVLRRVLELCLTKDVKRRVQDVADVRLAMEGAFETGTAAERAVPTPASRWRLAAVAAVLASLVTGLAFWSASRAAPPAITRFAYELPADHLLRAAGRPVLAVSPDGRRFAYNTSGGVFVREMDQLDARLLPGTEPFLRGLFFSPDGQWVGYEENRQLKRLALSGGAPIDIGPTTNFGSAEWTAGDVIFYGDRDGIFRVSADGGPAELVVPAGEGEVLDAPHLLPDGRHLLVSASGRDDWQDATTVAVSLETGERRVMVEDGSDARYVPSGHLIYYHGDGLFAVSFDAASLRVTSGSVSLAQGVRRASYAASGNYSVSDDGTLFFLSDTSQSERRLAWVDRAGRAEVLENIPPKAYYSPRLSPDGKRVLVTADGDAWIYDLENGRETRLTTDGTVGYVYWTPSGQEVTYTSSRGSPKESELWIQSADGSSDARQLTALGGQVDLDSWAPDGRTIAAHHHVGVEIHQLMIAYDGENAHPETWIEHEYPTGGAVFSPDSRYVALTTDETGQTEIVIRPFPGPGGQTPVSVGGGSEPFWAPTGELFYRRPTGYAMMAVEVQTDPVLRVGTPVELFTGRSTGAPGTSYAATADGQRFLMTTDALPLHAGAAGRTGPKIVVVQHWIEELEEHLPN